MCPNRGALWVHNREDDTGDIPGGIALAFSMAILRAQSSEHFFVLPARCLIGRSRACDLVIAGRDVSGQHAMLQWTGLRWELQDLGSRNGTYVDEVPAGKRTPVTLASKIRFGRQATWIVADVGPPRLMAMREDTREVRLSEGGLLPLSDADETAACIYQDPFGLWVCERHGEPTVLDDRTLLSVDNVAWRVHLPTASQATSQDGGKLVLIAGLRLRLTFSRDEEQVEAMAFTGQQQLDLGVRAYNYLLLVLARRRLDDRSAGIPDAEQGWIRQDDLLRMLRMSENHLNISVYRARTRLGGLGVADAASLIERRSGIRQLRLGIGDLELVPLHDRT